MKCFKLLLGGMKLYAYLEAMQAKRPTVEEKCIFDLSLR